MTKGVDEGDSTGLAPDDAFGALGNETRVRILQTLGEAGFGESLSYTELRDRVGLPQGAQFNYHLDKLVGHFVRKTDEGYALRPAGHRVVEAVLTGSVTDDPALGPEQLDQPCPYCGSRTEVQFHQDRLHRYCTECRGTYGHTALPGVSVEPVERGYLGKLNLPPVGVTDRTPAAVVEAAMLWTHFDVLKPANGICPRCSASVASSIGVCTGHDAGSGLCDECGHRHGIWIDHRCPKCTFDAGGYLGDWLVASDELVEFLVDHGINPVSPTPEDQRVWVDYEEELLSTDPFAARFTFTVDGDALTLRVDDDLNVVELTDGATTEAV